MCVRCVHVFIPFYIFITSFLTLSPKGIILAFIFFSFLIHGKLCFIVYDFFYCFFFLSFFFLLVGKKYYSPTKHNSGVTRKHCIVIKMMIIEIGNNV